MFILILSSILLLISIHILLYFLYADSLNKKLNIKKKYITEYTSKSRKHRYSFASFLVVILLSSLLGYSVYTVVMDTPKYSYIYSSEEFERMASYSATDDIVNKSFSTLQKEERIVENDEYSFILSNKQIIKYCKNSDDIFYYQINNSTKEGAIYLVQNMVIVCYPSGKITKVLVKDASSMQTIRIIDIDGKLLHTDIRNEYLNIIVINKGNVNPFSIGARINDSGKTGFIDKIGYMTKGKCATIVSHFQYNIVERSITQKAFSSTDIFLTFDDFYYVAFNIYEDNDFSGNV